MRHFALNPPESYDGNRGLGLRSAFAFTVLLFFAAVAPKVHADTLPTPCITSDYCCPIITNGPPELSYAHDQANITGQQLSGYGTVSVYSELIDSTGAIVNNSIQRPRQPASSHSRKTA